MVSKRFHINNIDKLNNSKRLELLNIADVCNHFDLKDSRVMVEIGTGTGIFADAFLNMIPGSICYGFDVLKEMLDWIKENNVHYLSGRFQVRLMEEVEIPLANNSGDFVFMIAVYHELDEPVKLLKECRRILKPGGKLMIADWRKDAMGKSPHHCPHHSKLIEMSELKLHLKEAEFSQIDSYEGSTRLFCLVATKGRFPLTSQNKE